jgi:hypothetical protein
MKRHLLAVLLAVAAASPAPAAAQPKAAERALEKTFDTFLKPVLRKDFKTLKRELLGTFRSMNQVMKGPASVSRFWDEIGKQIKGLLPKRGKVPPAAKERLYQLANQLVAGAKSECAAAAGGTRKRTAAGKGRAPSLLCALASKHAKGGVLDRRKLEDFIRDAGALGEELSAQAAKLASEAGQTEKLGRDAQGEGKKLLEGGMKAFESVVTLPDRLKKKIQDLIWMKPPPESPTDKRNDKRIEQWFRAQIDEVTQILNAPIFAFIPKDALQWLKAKSVEILAKLGTPFIRLLQFIDGKMKKAIAVMIRAGMEGAVNVDARVTALLRQMGIGGLPPFLLKAVTMGADVMGRTLGSFGGYLIKSNPQLESFVTDVVGGIADSGEALNEAMDTMIDTSLAVGGAELAPLEGEARQKFEAGLKKLGRPSKDPQYKAAVLKLRLEVNRESLARAFSIKREKVEEALGKILDAMARAFTTFATPLLNQAAGLVNTIVLKPALNWLGRKIVTWIINLIPEAGGAVGAIWDVIASVVIPFVLDTFPPIAISLTLEFIGDQMKDLRYDLMGARAHAPAPGP